MGSNLRLKVRIKEKSNGIGFYTLSFTLGTLLFTFITIYKRCKKRRKKAGNEMPKK